MTPSELSSLLDHLIATWENEVVEFKQASNDYSTDDIGKYFSGLANEANLRGADDAWLVFGVNNKTRNVVGTNFRPNAEHLNSLKHQIKQDTQPSITFRMIHQLQHLDGRVLLFEIPAAPQGVPVAWKGHYYARAGESLTSLGLEKQDEIRNQMVELDWTARVVSGATFADLDEAALRKAREFFAKKHANRIPTSEVENWPLETFLDRARVTRNGQLTRAAILLLGREESGWLLSPNPAQLTWKLEGPERAYEHFGPPFLLSTTWLYQRIRNIQLRLLPQDELLPIEVSKYDRRIVLEALHNCVAHQDYARNGRIVVTERLDRLLFENEGSFFDGLPDEYIDGNKTPRRYRNPFLARAMAELNMIDITGYGIHEVYMAQARRYLPLPDYDLGESHTVKLTIYGGAVDPAYTRLLMEKTDLPLADVLALDRVQKKLPISDEAAARLKRMKLIEGRKPNRYVSADAAEVTAKKADYIGTRSQSDDFYATLLTDYLEKCRQASRVEINTLLMDKLREGLDEKQKYNKITNLLAKLRRQGKIENVETDTAPRWQLTAKN